MPRVIRVSVLLLLVVLSLASGLFGITVNGERYTKAVQSYPSDGYSFSLNDIPDDAAANARATLFNYVDRNQAVITRCDDVLSQIDGSVELFRLGIYGSVGKHAEQLSLSFAGSPLLDGQKLSTLMEAKPGSTLGLDSNSADMVGDIPNVWDTPRLVAVQLPQLIDDSGTIRGNYSIVGVTSNQFDHLLTELSASTGVSTERLRHPLSGSFVDTSLLIVISLLIGLACALFAAVILFVAVFLGAQRYGVHLLLGWSRWDYAIKFYRPLLIGALVIALIPAGLTLWAFPGFTLSLELMSIVVIQILKFLFLVALVLVPSAIALALIKPVAAIRNRVSYKSLLALLIILFVSSSIGLVGAMHAIDGQLGQVRNLQEVQAKWHEYSHYNILSRETVGDNSSSFTGQSTELQRELYQWYASIQDSPGVNLVNTSYYDSKILNMWKGVYASVPSKPFWYLVASPNYLKNIKFEVEPKDVQAAHEGVRVYYLPDTFKPQERQNMEGWLSENDKKDRGNSIPTDFMRNPRIKFRTYHVRKPIFMWNSDLSRDFQTSDPVIYLATAQNMTPFESESLDAVGLENSYLKLSSEAVTRYTTPKYLAKYHLADNNPQFQPVRNFIAGLRKSLAEFIQLFGGVAVFIVAIVLTLLMSFVALYTKLYSQQVAVKRLLGYPLVSIFTMPFLLVIFVGTVSIILAILLGSNSGIALSIIMLFLQLLLLSWQAKQLATKQINSTIKEQ